MELANLCVGAILRSPAHRLLSGSTCLVRYEGRRSGRTYVTPAQYATNGPGIIVLVARPDAKTWWRNFRTDRSLDVLVAGAWQPMTGRAVLGAADLDTATSLLDTYLGRFPRSRHALRGETAAERAESAVLVSCRPLVGSEPVIGADADASNASREPTEAGHDTCAPGPAGGRQDGVASR
jgi:hypothetical protein